MNIQDHQDAEKWQPGADYKYKFGIVVTRSMAGLLVMVAAILCLSFLFIGKAIGTTKEVVIVQMPDHLYCQPSKSKEVAEAEAEQLQKLGFKAVPFHMLSKAFSDQSEGKGELLPQASGTCVEKIGRKESARATTYYFAKK